ncbi:hypothetical protein GM418_26370 [Maribellus comscasis]|uniref:Uncharacterized protein n=1 Tax=Maribellus comscasis TaxID=2681766 RepID=A0A6I6K0E6_9BACT|nr:hypothetical protein [Maribellus comscasis]QGY47059.1 hypothetical protein GM418_26370 [Maribellus comscasis]
MKTIRSNKKGFGIHSPFVYDLITNVLFVSAGFYVFDEIEKMNKSTWEKNQIKLLFRLLNYFQPRHVFYDENVSGDVTGVLQKFNSETVFKSVGAEFFKKEKLAIETKSAFFIFGKKPDVMVRSFCEYAKCFFLKQKTGKKENYTLKPLLEKEDGTILIELLTADFIIFDKKFRSQHYVIK